MIVKTWPIRLSAQSGRLNAAAINSSLYKTRASKEEKLLYMIIMNEKNTEEMLTTVRITSA